MRRFRLLVTASAILGAIASAVAVPAAAVTTETIVLTADAPVSKTFGPIPGNFPLTTAAIPEPYDCETPSPEHPGDGALAGSCDNVPIKIVPPKLAGNEDFLVTIKVTWTPTEDVDGTFVNDLDIYFYDDQQIGKRTNPKSTAYTNLGESASAVQPETIKLFSPDLGDYNLVVINWSGPNINYTVDMSMSVEGFDTPFEDLGPRFGATRNNSSSGANTFESFAAPVDFSAFEDAAPGVGATNFSAIAPAPVIGEVAALPDADFGASASPAFEEEFEAAEVALPAARLRPRAAGPVSGAVVAFWLGIAPLVLLAGLFLIVVRRSRRSFVFGPTA